MQRTRQSEWSTYFGTLVLNLNFWKPPVKNPGYVTDERSQKAPRLKLILISAMFFKAASLPLHHNSLFDMNIAKSYNVDPDLETSNSAAASVEFYQVILWR